MCVSTYGWMSGGTNPVTKVLQIIPFAEWYDIGDGFMSLD